MNGIGLFCAKIPSFAGKYGVFTPSVDESARTGKSNFRSGFDVKPLERSTTKTVGH